MRLLSLLRATLGHRRTRAAEARIAGAVALVTECGASYRRTYPCRDPARAPARAAADTTPPCPARSPSSWTAWTQALDRLPDVTPSPGAAGAADRAALAHQRLRQPHELRGPRRRRDGVAPVGPRRRARPRGPRRRPPVGPAGGARWRPDRNARGGRRRDRIPCGSSPPHSRTDSSDPSESTSRWGIDDV